MATERAGARHAHGAAPAASRLVDLATQLRIHGARQGPALASAVLGLAICVQLVQLVVDMRVALAPIGREPAARSRGQGRRAIDPTQIVNAHLFGGAASAAPGPAEPAVTALVLTGVIAADDPGRGMGILGPSSQAARLYTVGESLPGGSRLQAVYPDHVVFERDGSLETLYLPKNLATSGAAAPQLALRRAAEPVEIVADAAATATSIEAMQSEGGATPAQRRAAVARAHEDWARRNSSN